MFEKCELCQKWDFQNVNFVKNEISKCEFWEKWDVQIVNFEKNEKNKISKMWSL